jgi:hypothetical protein
MKQCTGTRREGRIEQGIGASQGASCYRGNESHECTAETHDRTPHPSHPRAMRKNSRATR